MSVAFRRDSDEEHREPKFAIPIPPGPNLVTPRGKALIDEQVVARKAALASAADDAAKADAKRTLAYWQNRAATAELAPPASGTQVEFGTNVTFTLNGLVRSLSIVGIDEADTSAGLIGFTAPLARALMGAEVGDVVPFGGRDEAIEILTISPAAPLPPSSP